MRLTLGVPTLEPSDNWRAAMTLACYRTVVGFGLMAIISIGQGLAVFEPSMPDAFRLTCLLYLAQSVILLLLAMIKRPGLRAHVMAQIAFDTSAFTLLAYTGAGVTGGLGMLLIAPLAAGGILLPDRLSVLLAACATLAMIGQEVVRGWQLDQVQAELVQAGILGGVYFAAVGLAQWLARRVRISEALAADRASEVRDLAEINRRIIDRMQIGALVVDRAGGIQTINQAALGLLGDEPTRRMPRSLLDLSPALSDALTGWLSGAAPSQQVLHYDGRALLPTFARLDTGDDAPLLLFVEDARRQSEQAQQIKLASLGRLTASIAHEIRNPLGAISHAGQLLAESARLGTEEARLLEIMHRHTRRIDAIVSNALGLSRRSGHGRSALVLNEWLDRTVADYCSTRTDPPHFDYQSKTFEHLVTFDPGHLRQVLFNLWDNSDRYARRSEAPVITLECMPTRNGDLAMAVRDNGPGIDAAIIDQILEPFFTTARDGTGLGLHIARELCEANGARLSAVANSGGAYFRVVFAAHQDAAEEISLNQ
ncbi:MAG: ATP-binding protein [Salinisphaera sp.]|nr:ATP-binding protein [Salinisphaera sp.]